MLVWKAPWCSLMNNFIAKEKLECTFINVVLVVVFWGCCNEGPQTRWLKTEMYCFSVLTTGSPKSKRAAGPCSLKSLGKNVPLPLLTSDGGDRWCSGSRQLHGTSLCFRRHCFLPHVSVSVMATYKNTCPCPSWPLIRIPVTAFRAHPDTIQPSKIL